MKITQQENINTKQNPKLLLGDFKELSCFILSLLFIIIIPLVFILS